MWPLQTSRWIVALATLWALMAFLRCLLHQSWILSDGFDDTSFAWIFALIGFYCGVWMALCQRLVFAGQTVWQHWFWGGIGALGIWLLSPATDQLEAIVKLFLDRIITSSRSSDGMAGVSFWVLGLAPVLSIWLAHPLFRYLTLHPTQDDESTVPFLAATPASNGILLHPWTIRIVILTVATIWLKSNLEVRQLPSEAFGIWLLLVAVASVMSVVTWIPYYLSITARRRWLGFLLFHMIWFVLPFGIQIAAWVYQSRPSFAPPNDPTTTLLRVCVPMLSAFAAAQLLSFWASCYFRDRAVLYLPKAVLASLRQSSANADERFAAPSSTRPFRWAQFVFSALLASLLFGVIVWSSAFLQRQFHVAVWWTTDADAWNRATAIARLQSMQDSYGSFRNDYRFREWDYHRPLMVRRDGSIFCKVTKEIVAESVWKSVRTDVEASFPFVSWTMDFPISDPADIGGSAYSVLKIDGEKLRLKDVPQPVSPITWEVYGGTIDADDLARAARGPHGLRFDKCFFEFVDFQATPRPSYRSISLADCTFAHPPTIFPPKVWMTFEFTDVDDFIKGHEWYIPQMYNGGTIQINATENGVDADALLQQLPEPWRNLVSIRYFSNTKSLSVERVPIEQLAKSASVLPANLNTRSLATDASGQITGVDTSLWRDHRAVWNSENFVDHSLDWMSLFAGSGFESVEGDNFSVMLKNSWLVEIVETHGDQLAFLANKLSTQQGVDAGDAILISNLANAHALDLLPALANRQTLIIESSACTPTFVASLAKLPQFSRIVVLIDGDAPNPGETADIQQLQAAVKPKVEVLRQPNTNGDLVRWLKSTQPAETNGPSD